MIHEEKEIELLIKAQYPIIYIVSHEEKRVMNKLKKIAERLRMSIAEWKVTTGLKGWGVRTSGTQDPLIALNHVSETKGRIMFIFHDLHPWLDKRHSQHVIITRKLRDLINILINVPTILILLSPVLTIPTELEKDIAIVDFPLPNYEEIENTLNKIKHDIEGDPKLRIELTEEEKEKIIKATLGLTQNEIENLFSKMLADNGKLDIADLPKILEEKKQILRKTGILEFIEVKEGFEHIGGLDELKKWLKERALGFSERARKFGLPAPRGVLLIGIPGCGKSLSAKVAAAEWKVPLLRLDMGRIYGKYVGESEANIRRAIKTAESLAPCILWIDEIEKGISGAFGQDTTGVAPRVFATLLTWMQEKTKPVFVFATANEIELLPPELLRKGRFDELFFVDLPTKKERKEIFEIHLRKRGFNPEEFDIEVLAQESDGYSGSEIEEAIISAMYKVFSLQKSLKTEDILWALKETKPLSETMKEAIEEMRRWAEGRARYASKKEEKEKKEKRPLIV